MISYEVTTRIASVQAEPVWFDADATVSKSIELIAEAAKDGAQLIAFPEVFLSGYPWQHWLGTMGWATQKFAKQFHANAVSLHGDLMQRVRDAARSNSISVVMGYSEQDAGSLYMSQAFIGPEGEILDNRRKVKPTHVERAIYGEGDGSDLKVLGLPIGRVGGLNCWEHYQPLSKYAMFSLHEQIHVASWPSMSMDGFYIHSSKASEEICRTYAMEGQTFVAIATQIVSQAAHDFFCETEEQSALLGFGGGFARIIGPDGGDITEPLAPDVEGLLIADADLSDITVAKSFADPVGHYSRPDALSLNFNNSRNRRVWRNGDAASSLPSALETGDAGVFAEDPQEQVTLREAAGDHSDVRVLGIVEEN